MKIYKFFREPKFHDAAFYQDREPADHINENVHRERLLRTVADVMWLCDIDEEIKSMCDLGCGTGGLLSALGNRIPRLNTHGYDLSPKAVEAAKMWHGMDARLLDFTAEPVELADIVTLNETLEHLVDPEGLLERLKGKCRWIVASVPAFEDDKRHYEYHLWAWDTESFPWMFGKLGFQIITHYVVPAVGTQFLIARAS